MTSDAKAAEEFYARVIGGRMVDAGQLGMAYTLAERLFLLRNAVRLDQKPSRRYRAMGTYQLFGKDGPDFGGMMSLPGVPISSWMYYFRTGYIDAAVKRFAEADDTVINGPMQVPGGD